MIGLPTARRTVSFNVNLLPQDPFFDTLIGRTLRWAVSIGRYVVMFTELIVIVSFATRFTLDRQLTDLNDSISQKSSLIRSYGDLENNIRSAQAKIEQYQQVEQQKNLADVFPALSAIVPSDVVLDDLSIKPTTITLSGNTYSQQSLNLLVNNIQLSSAFFNVSVDRIETDTQNPNQVFFKITADTVQQQAPTAATRPVEKVNILDRTQGL